MTAHSFLTRPIRARLTSGESNKRGVARDQRVQTVGLWSAAGNVIVRNRGVIRQAYLFDTLDDGEPGSDYIGEAAVGSPRAAPPTPIPPVIGRVAGPCTWVTAPT